MSLSWNGSDIPIEGFCVAISAREGDQRSSFTEIIEQFEVCSVNDTMKTTVHNKGVIGACRTDSEECQELHRSYDSTLGLEHQSCLSRPELRPRPEKNLSRIEHPWPEEEDGTETVPVRESDTTDSQLKKIFLTTPILREILNVLNCRNNWRAAVFSLVETILRALEQFFMKSQMALREFFSMVKLRTKCRTLKNG